MPMKKQLSSIVLAVMVFAIGSVVARADDQPQTERRVFVIRTNGEQDIDLETVGSERGFLGVGLLDLTPDLRRHFSVPEDRGVMVSEVVSDSPAGRAGLLPADILTAFDGDPLTTPMALSMRVARAREGDTIELERWRDGRSALVTIPLEVRRRPQLDLSPLIRRRLASGGERPMEIRAEGGSKGDMVWIEDVVETVDESFAGTSLMQQLEALRQERADLLEQIEQMEGRLSDLESELQGLDCKER
jgi:membrane-associated protease RseP (regulator of RpoE activity)